MMDTLFLLALNGLIWGLIIALIALGLSIIFGLLDIINIAHGDFFMVGTVLAWFTLELTGNFWAAFLIVPLIGFILGALVQRVVIQPIRNVAALVFPDIEACRKLSGLSPDASSSAIVEAGAVRARFAELMAKLAAASPRAANNASQHKMIPRPRAKFRPKLPSR